MTRISTVSALALAVSAGPALADVTPQQVWDNLEAYMQGFGYAISATEAMQGGTLTVTDLSITVPVPEEDVEITMTLPEMILSDNGDGSVAVSYPPAMPMTVLISEDDTQVGEMIFDITQNGFLMNVSGAPENMVYDYSAESMALALTRLVAEGEEISRDKLRVDMTLAAMAGRSEILRTGGMQAISQAMTLGDLSYDVAFNDPDAGSSGLFDGGFRDLSSTTEMVLPEDLDFSDPATLMASGLAVDTVVTHKGGTTNFSVDEGAGATVGKFSSAGGKIGVTFSEQSLTYGISATGQTLALSGPDLPLPIDAAMEELGFSLTAPFQPGDAPQAANLSVILGGFTMSEMLWNLFDPAAALPRDPATLAVKVETLLSPKFNMLDIETMERMADSEELPVDLHSATISDLVIEAVGGLITGQGAFTFDMTDTTTLDGMPRPAGTVSLNVTGANALIEKLTEMGLMAEGDANQARMMLSMFTIPGDQPDSATSQIEITDEFHIIVNGQRIQ